MADRYPAKAQPDMVECADAATDAPSHEGGGAWGPIIEQSKLAPGSPMHESCLGPTISYFTTDSVQLTNECCPLQSLLRFDVGVLGPSPHRPETERPPWLPFRLPAPGGYACSAKCSIIR